MKVYHQAVKIIKQLLGKENIFGYQTTLANQLFLLYCFCGKIYFTSKIDNYFKFIWMLHHLSGLLIGYVVAVVFLLNDKEPDILIQLYMINVISNSTLMGFLIPFVTYWYRDSIEKTIRDIDKIIHNRSLRSHRSSEKNLDLWTFVFRNIVFELVSGAVFGNICALDVIIFYEEDKVKNYAYYLFPFPNTEEVGSFGVFLINTGLSFIILSSQAIEALSALTLILTWNVVSHSQLDQISRKLEYESANLSSYIEKNQLVFRKLSSTEKAFKKIVIQGVRDFQKVTRLIENLRWYYQSFCSVAVPVSIIGVTVQLHSIVSTNLPMVVKIKGIGMMGAMAFPLLIFCWIGETLDDSVSKVSFSVYLLDSLVLEYTISSKYSSISLSDSM